jgi:hypothetical protein
MAFFFSVMQMFGWILVGYNLAKSNMWAMVAVILANIIFGLVQAMNMVGKELREHGNSSKSK